MCDCAWADFPSLGPPGQWLAVAEPHPVTGPAAEGEASTPEVLECPAALADVQRTQPASQPTWDEPLTVEEVRVLRSCLRELLTRQGWCVSLERETAMQLFRSLPTDGEPLGTAGAPHLAALPSGHVQLTSEGIAARLAEVVETVSAQCHWTVAEQIARLGAPTPRLRELIRQLGRHRTTSTSPAVHPAGCASRS